MSTELSLSKQAGKNWKKNRIPTSGSFELTPRCTLDCKMCYVHLTKDQMAFDSELTTEEWINIIDDAVENGLLFAVVTGGECMLHPGFREIYLHLLEKHVMITLNSNATLINDEWIEFFKAYRPAKFQVSIYGNTEDGYEKITGFRMCEKVKNNVLKLKEAGINIQVAITCCKYNYDEALDIVRFCNEHSIHNHFNTSLREANDETERKMDDFGLSIEEDIDIWKRSYAYAGRECIPPEQPFDDGVPPLQDKVSPGLQCSAGRNNYAICWNGMMQGCLSFRSKQSDVRKLGFKKAWEETVKNADEFLTPVECYDCKLFDVCEACAMSRVDLNNPGHRNASVCERTIAKYNAGILRKK